MLNLRNSTERHLLTIIILAVAARLVVALILGNRIDYLPAIADQTSYQTLAERLLAGHGFTFGYDWWPATRAGEPTAHWSYFYTLYLVVIYKIFGNYPLAARLVQAALAGVLMPWLTFRIARRVFTPEILPIPSGAGRFSLLAPLIKLWKAPSELIPLLAAAWVALYGYFIYFAAALMTETFYIIGILWSIDCALRIGGRFNAQQPLNPSSQGILIQQSRVKSPTRFGQLSGWVELSVAISITAILRQVFLLFVPFLFLWLLWIAYRRNRMIFQHTGRRFRSAFVSILPGSLVVALVMVLFIAPITLFNYHQFGSFVLLNTNAGYAFYWSNHPIYGSKYISLLTEDMPTYYDLLPKDILWMNEADLDHELLRRGLEFVVADPRRYLLLSLDRIPAYFIFWPLPNSSLISNITRTTSFGIALPFIIIGIWLWCNDVNFWKKNTGNSTATPDKNDSPSKHGPNFQEKGHALEAGVLLLLFALIYSLVHLLSWAGIRYRLPVDAVTLIFAARALYAFGGVILFKKNRYIPEL